MKKALAVLVSFFSVTVLSASARIHGQITDPFGKGLGAVQVQILKSGFKALSDTTGRYTIDYAPGVFTLRFSQPGFTTVQYLLYTPERDLWELSNQEEAGEMAGKEVTVKGFLDKENKMITVSSMRAGTKK